MVSGDDKLELRAERKEILSHVASGDVVAAGERLQLGLRPSTAAFGFLGYDETGTT